MKIRYLLPVIFILATLVSLFAGCDAGKPPEQSTRDFNLIFKYGIRSRNELNTFRDTYTKDLISDPSITVKMVLSDDEFNRIYDKMLEIDFFSYPDVFIIPIPPDRKLSVITPFASYYFLVEYEDGIKELWWADERRMENEEADKLRELIKLIREIIEDKPEYKELPEPTGAYLKLWYTAF